MADNPVVKRDLVEQILELRNEVENRLMRNKYYMALKKLDELVEAIRPLEAEVIEEERQRQHPALAGGAPSPRDRVPGAEAAVADPAGGQAEPAAPRHEWDEPPTPEARRGDVDAGPGEEPLTHGEDADVDLLADEEDRPAQPGAGYPI